MSFGNRLQELRKEQGLSQEGLADQMGVSRQAVSKWELGDSYPEVETLVTLAQMLDVSLDYLVKGEVKDSTETREVKKTVSLEEANEYLKVMRKHSFLIGLGVFFLITAAALTLFFEHLKEGLLFLPVAGIGIVILVVTGIQHRDYESWKHKRNTMKASDITIIEKGYKKAETQMAYAIGGAIVLMITGLVVAYASEDYLGDATYGIFILCVAFGVWAIVYFTSIYGSYRVLVRNEEVVNENRTEDKNNSVFGITMPLAAMVFLLIGFTTNLWHPGWMVFPITALLTSAYVQIKQGK